MIVFKKISIKGDQVTLVYSNPERKQKTGDEFKEAPLPEFREALQALDIVRNDLPLAMDEIDELVIGGVSLKYHAGEYVGATISASVKIEEMNRPWNFNTPLIDILTDENVTSPMIEKLVSKAKRYLAGERAQGVLDLDGKENGEGGEAEETSNQEPPGVQEPAEQTS